jgi:hypothetical protein
VNFRNERHALYVGWVVAQMMVMTRMNARPVGDDNGDWLPRVRIIMDDPKKSFELEIPEPDPDWMR